MARNPIQLIGADILGRRLQRMAERVGPQFVEPVLFDAAEIVADSIRSKAPTGPTGNLKRSIIAKQMPRSGDRIAPSIAAVDRSIANRDGVPYPHIVEFGSSKMAAKPYLRPGWDTSRGQAKQKIKEGLKRLVDEGARS